MWIHSPRDQPFRPFGGYKREREKEGWEGGTVPYHLVEERWNNS